MERMGVAMEAEGRRLAAVVRMALRASVERVDRIAMV